MRLPRSVTVLGDKIAIIEVTDKQMAPYCEPDEDILGLALLLENKILILKDIPHKEKLRVVSHELFHIVIYKMGLRPNPTAEEVFCQAFAIAHAQLKEQGL